MVASIFKRLAKASAAPVMVLRGLIVGANFAVMLGLAAVLGLEGFGQLAVTWGLGLVASSVIAMGVPLYLLQALSEGGKLRPTVLLHLVVIYPLVLAVVATAALSWTFPDLPWPAIMVTAFAVHLASCLGSIMRALGSVQWSMVLRDAGPQLALGLAGLVTRGDGAPILLTAAFVLFAFNLAAAMWCWRHIRRSELIGSDGGTGKLPVSLWGTSVLGMMLAQVDIIVGGAFLSDGQIGLYALLRRLTNLVALPVSVATWVTSIPVAAAHRIRDHKALARASAMGSQIALLPGLLALLAGLTILAVIQSTGFRIWDAPGTTVCIVLLAGAFSQIWFAATFTVATLCDMARFSAFARLSSVLIYLGLIAAVPNIGLVYNAVAYVLAVLLGSLLLWVAVYQKLGIDTSARVLLGKEGGRRWRHS